MTTEIYKLKMPERVFVFIATRSAERLAAMGDALRGLGATDIGPQSFALRRDGASPEAVRDALGELEEGECVYRIGAVGGALEHHLFVRARTGGGTTVR